MYQGTFNRHVTLLVRWEGIVGFIMDRHEIMKEEGDISYEFTAWKVSKYGVFSAPYFPVSSRNTGKCGPEKTPCLDTFHAMVT